MLLNIPTKGATTTQSTGVVARQTPNKKANQIPTPTPTVTTHTLVKQSAASGTTKKTNSSSTKAQHLFIKPVRTAQNGQRFIIARCTCQAVDKQIQRMSAKQQRHLPTAQLATETTPNQSKHQKRYVFFVVLIFFCGSSIVFLRITMFFIAHIYFNWLSLFFSGFVQFNLALKGF